MNLNFLVLASAMKNIRTPFWGIINDIKGRAACYKEDWICAFCSGIGYNLICFGIAYSSSGVS
jgi:hypothetical protein